MLTISYNISATLKNSLFKVDALRQKILSIPVSPQTETIARWQATLTHLEGWASLSNQPLTKTYIIDVLNQLHTKTAPQPANKILNYKNAINYLREFWPANPARVSSNTIRELANILGVNPGSEKEVESLLNYLQTGQVHPVIQSATAHLYFYPSRLAYLSSLLFLAKHGYDLRGWLSLEDYWNQNKQEYLAVIQKASSSTNTTLWLEFFCQAMLHQMEKIHSALIHPPQPSHMQPAAFWQITKRQQQILDQLNQPGLSIANKEVQSLYKVHQITASRDLSKLATLGLLIPHGHGRSTKYTKV